MNVLIGVLHIVESIERLNKVRAYILSDSSIGIMCYAVIEVPLLLKNKSTLNSSSGSLLCLLSVSHGYRPISGMKRRKIISKNSTILISDIDESEKVNRDNEVLLKKAKYIHQYSEFVRCFNTK
ncbi:MAG: hypothetical protein V3V33_03105 [Candidatus Lokiarchaeia archaeon]